jgi:hypothetical protein
MPWLNKSSDGLSRDQLLQLLSITREQRNEHRAAMFQFLQFYLTVVAALLAAELTLCTFAIPFILNNVRFASQRAALFLLLAMLPMAILFLVRLALLNVRKEYEKLIEYLTVEQKLQAVLGLMQPLSVTTVPDVFPYPHDNALIYDRWITGSMTFDTSVKFVTYTVARIDDGAFAPLRRALRVIAYIGAILLVALIIWAAVVLI